MARAPDKRIEQAEAMYHEGIKLVEIASQLNLPEGTVRSWKNRNNWDCNVAKHVKRNVAKKKRGAQPGNKNSHGGPPGNSKAEKYGFFRKYLPQETMSIIEEMPKDPLDILWDQIQIAYAAIIRAQQIMYVTDRDDMTTTRIKESNGEASYSEAWEVQQAWDKQANFMSAQARAQKTLDGLIKRYDELLNKRWDLATEEQKARIEQIKVNTERMAYAADPGDNDGVEIINDAPKETG